MHFHISVFLCTIALLTSADYSFSDAIEGRVPEVTLEKSQLLNAKLAAITSKHQMNTAGIAIIKQGKLVWTGYFGEQSPGVPASADTLFNVGSITKAVTAETVLRLVDKEKISLDESMANFWIDTDLADDPRHKLLTPKIALNHTTGFPNWRFFTEDRKLKFLNEPGTQFGYSGEGFEYLALFAEKKLGKGFEQLVKENVFDPLEITDAAYAIDKATFPHIAQAKQADGSFSGHYCRPNGWCRKPGDWSAADDLVISVKAYSKFLISVMNQQGYNQSVVNARNAIAQDKNYSDIVDCQANTNLKCPVAQGYGLGWSVIDYGDYKVIGHGGSDWAETAQGYFYSDSRDGVIVFLNGPSVKGLAAMAEILEEIDPNSPLAGLYRRWHTAAVAKD
jgi:CubicO group peptidase (beta-lactamase class C family)